MKYKHHMTLILNRLLMQIQLLDKSAEQQDSFTLLSAIAASAR
jgi:hypothetical protein